MGFDNLSAEYGAARREEREREERRKHLEAVHKHFEEIKTNRFRPRLAVAVYPEFLNKANQLPAKMCPEMDEAQLQQLLNSNNIAALAKILGKKWPAIRNRYLNLSKAEYWAWIQQLCKTYVLIQKQTAIIQFVKAHPELTKLSSRSEQEAFYEGLIQFMRAHLASNAFYQDVERLCGFFPASCKEEAPLNNNNNDDETALPDAPSQAAYPSSRLLAQYLIELFQAQIRAEEQEKAKIEEDRYKWLPGICYAIHLDVQCACSNLQSYLRQQERLTQQLDKEVFAFQASVPVKQEEVDTSKNSKVFERFLLTVLTRYKIAIKTQDNKTQTQLGQWIKCLVGYGYSPFNLLPEMDKEEAYGGEEEFEYKMDKSSSSFELITQSLEGKDNELNIKAILRRLDWEILEECLRYLDPPTQVTAMVCDKLFLFCADSKKEVSEWYRRMWINGAIKKTRQSDVADFLMTLYQEKDDINSVDQKLLLTIQSHKVHAPRSHSSSLYGGLNDVMNKQYHWQFLSLQEFEKTSEKSNNNTAEHKAACSS